MDNSYMVLGLAFSLALIGILVAALRTKKLSRRSAVLMGLVSLLVTGLVLGGVPDPVMQLAQLIGSTTSGQFQVLPLIGLLMLLTTTLVLGRAFCSYACPLGVAQELAFLAPLRKIKIRPVYRSAVRWTFFLVFVIIAISTTIYAALNPLRFFGLSFVLIPTLTFTAIVVTALFVYRPWCNLLCPFGAIAALTSRWSVLKLRRTGECIDCGRCVKACPIDQPVKGGSMTECYYCGRCLDACPRDSLGLLRGQ